MSGVFKHPNQKLSINVIVISDQNLHDSGMKPFVALMATLAVLPQTAKPVTITTTMQQIEHQGLLIEDLSMRVTQSEQLINSVTASIRSLTDTASDITLSDIRYQCADHLISESLLSCSHAEFSATSSLWPDRLEGIAEWSLDRPRDNLSFALTLPMLGGKAQVTGRAQGDDLDIRITLDQLSLEVLARQFMPTLLDDSDQLGGELSAIVDVMFTDADTLSAPQLVGEYSVSGLSADVQQGSYAAAELMIDGGFHWTLDPVSSRLNISTAIRSGELLAGPVYLDFSAIPGLNVVSELFLSDALSPSQIDLTVRDEDALNLQASITLAADLSLERVAVTIEQLSLAEGFDRYLKGLLEPSGWHTINPQGDLNGELLLVGQSLEQLTLAVTEVSLLDDKNRIEFSNLNGIVDYSVSGDSSDSWLSWGQASVYQMSIGTARAEFFTGGQMFQLLKPLTLPIFDGSLNVSELLVTDLRSDEVRVDFNARLEPISMRDITRALQWPEFSGTVSGTIPGVTLSGDMFEVAGDIDLNVFGGLIRISDLEIERLFGVLPSLSATIGLDDLDLQQVTGTFSFGEIQGRLDGHVNDLRLLNWSPVAFDLELMTPEKTQGRDLGEQRISQRAINNISSIGGGAAILSNTVMRFFDDFSYRRLGIRCRLFNHVCRMSGIEPAERGYYLIKGAGLPRINIIGYSSEVNWPQLISRLQAATRTGPASVN